MDRVRLPVPIASGPFAVRNVEKSIPCSVAPFPALLIWSAAEPAVHVPPRLHPLPSRAGHRDGVRSWVRRAVEPRQLPPQPCLQDCTAAERLSGVFTPDQRTRALTLAGRSTGLRRDWR